MQQIANKAHRVMECRELEQYVTTRFSKKKNKKLKIQGYETKIYSPTRETTKEQYGSNVADIYKQD